MPVYQYACTECGEQLEVRQTFAEASLTECPACEGRLRKVLNAVGVVFKGSGFYRNDSRASAKDGAGAAKNGEATSTSEGSSKKESTTASASAGSDGKKSASDKGSADKGSSAGKGSSDKGSAGGAKTAPAAAH